MKPSCASWNLEVYLTKVNGWCHYVISVFLICDNTSANFLFVNLFEIKSQLALFLLHYFLKQQIVARRTSHLLFFVRRSKIYSWKLVDVIWMHCCFSCTTELLILFNITWPVDSSLDGSLQTESYRLWRSILRWKSKCINSRNGISILHCFAWTLPQCWTWISCGWLCIMSLSGLCGAIKS